MERAKLTVGVPRDLLQGTKRYAEMYDTTITRLVTEYQRQLTARHDWLADAPHGEVPLRGYLEGCACRGMPNTSLANVWRLDSPR